MGARPSQHHPHRTAARTALAAVAIATLIAGCGGNDPEPGAPTSTSTGPAPTATTAPAPEPSDTASPGDLPSDEAADSAAPWDDPTGAASSADAQLTATALRTGAQVGYDRVVLEFTGQGTPGWTAHRSNTAVEDPTGELAPIEGEGYLLIVASGLLTPPDGGLPAGSTAPGISVVTGASFTGVFEGESQLWIGLTAPDAPYRVFTLTNPTRLVIDVQRSMA
ncbi:AMIN-like domain-containing (lipo)protein [Cellulomonas denverensis]|uniref:AMIN-like domain-containing protein n=1 Tax=Cellulomonas denverensis TaxID=264297 RepID=A0A7X6KY40_9CELL|nr:hypothetical protein [Cellulomonas denverensis]NKY24125.1 hypothetical protein [Cellulomonas denverensis]GIG25302.1 hypothetical protein Cde04nite_15460 [Cellulomonas denverensis]